MKLQDCIIIIFLVLIISGCIGFFITNPVLQFDIPDNSTFTVTDKNIEYSRYDAHYLLNTDIYGQIIVDEQIYNKIHINDTLLYHNKDSKETCIIINRNGTKTNIKVI